MGSTGGLYDETANGGYGGYSTGEVYLEKGETLYINVGGAGGSGYIGNTLLTNKTMYCYNCEESEGYSTKTLSTTNVSETPIANYAKKGHGYARITLIEKK